MKRPLRNRTAAESPGKGNVLNALKGKGLHEDEILNLKVFFQITHNHHAS
jgi:hypothetical protein